MKIGLVLEGGALRGLYTAGVLDCFLKNNIQVDGVYASSAGAMFGINYISKQQGRVLRFVKKLSSDKRYMGFKSYLTTGNIINKDYSYYKLPMYEDPFDELTFQKNYIPFYASLTNVETGQAEYKEILNTQKDVEYLRASSSMPFLSKIVKIKSKKYLDGGLADSIPLKICKKNNYDKIIVILTREEDHIERKNNQLLTKIVYHKYPNLVKIINNRYKEYNSLITEINKLAADKQIFLIRPSKHIEMKSLERNNDKLQSMYDLGLNDANKLLNDLKKYISA